MHNATQSALPGTSRLFETEAEAQTAVVQITEIMDGLEAVVAEETELVRAGQLRKATGLGPKKGELSGRYFKAAEGLKANGKFLARVVPQDVGALARRHERLQAALKTNQVVLATAHAVSEGIMRRLSGDLGRKTSPQVYGASGRTSVPDPKRAPPIALSRTL
jgi:hypothetical protein